MKCPCGRLGAFGPLELPMCCGRFLDSGEAIPDPESLMRSRYTAYAMGRFDHVLATWHPDHKPDRIGGDGIVWQGLNVVSAQSDEHQGEVEFIAQYALGGSTGEIHERSRFVKIRGKWVYVDGDLL